MNSNIPTRNISTISLSCALTLVVGCTQNRDEHAVDGLSAESVRPRILFAIERPWFDERGSGTLFVRVNDGRGGESGGRRHVDDAGVAWQQPLLTPVSSFAFDLSYPWDGEMSLVAADSTAMVLDLSHDENLCSRSCRLTLWYTEEVLDGSDVQLFWDVSPGLWRQAELDYVHEEVISRTTVASYETDTGRVVLNVPMVTIQREGENLVAAMQSHEWDMVDHFHPAVSGISTEDVAVWDTGVHSDAGTTTE